MRLTGRGASPAQAAHRKLSRPNAAEVRNVFYPRGRTGDLKMITQLVPRFEQAWNNPSCAALNAPKVVTRRCSRNVLGLVVHPFAARTHRGRC